MTHHSINDRSHGQGNLIRAHRLAIDGASGDECNQTTQGRKTVEVLCTSLWRCFHKQHSPWHEQGYFFCDFRYHHRDNVINEETGEVTDQVWGWHHLVSGGYVEYVDTEEEETTLIAMTLKDLNLQREAVRERRAFNPLVAWDRMAHDHKMLRVAWEQQPITIET